jgi:hypothetical protein
VTGNLASTVPVGDAGHQGDYGEQFVEALAIAAGLDVSKTRYRDRRGVDWTLQHPARYGSTRFPSIEAQVKSWSRPKGDALAWHYPLRVANFNELAGGDLVVPRFLFLVIIPDGVDHWTEISHDCFTLRHAAYWANFLYDDPIDAPPESTHTVLVPKTQLITTASIYALFDQAFASRRAS